MKIVQTGKHTEFDPVIATDRAQAAIMELQPGGMSDEAVSNEHPRSEQWLYVVSGSGSATVVARNGRRRTTPLRAGSLLLIERGELHQIKNTGKKPLHTINFYIPPAYRSDGKLRRRAKGA